MGDAQTFTAANIITQMRYTLRDTNSKVWSDDELLAYLNDWSETVYKLLVDDKAEVVRTGTGTITTVDGTETYALASNSMGDFWIPYRVWIAGYTALEQVDESTRYDYEQTDASLTERQPQEYYIEGGNIGLLPVPDTEYTVRVKYFPNFVPMAATTSAMPYRGLFNQQIMQGAILSAKNRQMHNAGIEAMMLQLHQDIAYRIAEKRQKRTSQIMPRFS